MDKKDIVLFVIFGVLIIGTISFGVWVWITYHNVPVSELPAWVLPYFTK